MQQRAETAEQERTAMQQRAEAAEAERASALQAVGASLAEKVAVLEAELAEKGAALELAAANEAALTAARPRAHRAPRRPSNCHPRLPRMETGRSAQGAPSR